MKFLINEFQIHLIDEPTYTPGSSDNLHKYGSELFRNSKYQHASAVGVFLGNFDKPDKSIIILGVGGATGVHSNSLCTDGKNCFIAAGDSVFSLRLPSLKQRWANKVDFATCFGVYWIEEEKCLITWGEVDICRFTASGEKQWCVSGMDIFTEKFHYDSEYIEVTDFNSDQYRICIKTFRSKI